MNIIPQNAVLMLLGHIDDYVMVNGLPVQRVRPGSGFYCDVSLGNYVINVLGHKSDHLKVSVKPGQVCTSV